MRYGGYSEPIEVLVEILKEQQRTNELLEQMMKARDSDDHKPAATVTQQRRNKRSSDHAE